MANQYINLGTFFMLYDRRTFKQLSGDQGQDQGEPSNLQFCLDVAASKLDSYLNGRVLLPLTQIPLFLTGIVADMAAYMLFMRRPDCPDAIKQANERAMDWMNNFIAGGVTIPGADFAAPLLQDSNSRSGQSEFDTTYDTFPSPTAPGQPQSVPGTGTGGPG